MPTSSKGGALTPRQARRALRELNAKAAASRQRAKQTEARAQQVNTPQARRARAQRKPLSGVEKALGTRTIQYSGIPAGGSPLKTDIIGRTGVGIVKDLADAAIHSPGGLYLAGKAVTLDEKDALKRKDFSFKRSRALAAALAKGTAEDIKHPLRHPGFTALDLLAVGSAGAGAAARGTAAASRLAEEGSAASRLAGAGKALVRQPEPGSRTYKLGDLEVQTPNSRNALLRAGQKLHARQVNKGANEGRSAKIVAKHLTEERRVHNALERAPAEALASRGRRLTSPMETALRAVHEETPLEATIAMHQRELAEAKVGSQTHADLRQKILLAEAAKKYVVNVEGKPELRPAYRHLRPSRSPKRLAEVSGRIEDVGAEREAVLKEAGKLTPEEIQHRKAAPRRVAAGARYEPPTPAKVGRPPVGLEKMRAYVTRLEKLHARALERAGEKAKPYPPETIKVPGGESKVTRAMTHDEAKARLAELDKKYEKALKGIEPHVAPEYEGTVKTNPLGKSRSNKGEMSARQFEQSIRNTASRRTGKRMTVSAEIRRRAEDKLHELAAKHPEQQFAKDIAERDKLREALHGQLPGEAHGPLPHVTETVKTPHTTKYVPSDIPARGTFTPITTRLGGALSVARDRLAQMEAAAARRQKPVGLVGGEYFSDVGKTRIPYTSQAGVKVGRPATYRGGEPLTPASLRKPYTGTLQRTGSYRTKSSRLVAESALEAQRYNDVLRVRDRVLQASVESVPTGEIHDYVAVKVGSVPKPAGLQMLENKAEEGLTLTRAEKQQLAKSFDDWKAQMFAEPSELKSFKGYRFVRRELVDKLNKPRILATLGQSKILAGTGRAVMEVNNAVRTSLLYLAPKYAVPNVLGNAFLNVMQQGVRFLPNMIHVFTKIDRDPELAAYYRSAMGEGFSHQLTATSGLTHRISQPLARGWSKIVDEKFRESALADEMKRAGFKTPEEEKLAFIHHDPRAIEAVQRAKEAIGDYERLSPAERDIARHAIFFYTWLKVSARLSKHIITEHPIQAQLLAQLGRQGAIQQRKDLGPLPSFLEPVFRVGGTHEHPIVSNPSSANVFTAADVAKGIMNLVSGNHNQSGYQIAGNLSPFLALAVSEITGRDLFTQQPLKGNIGETALQNLTGTSPQLLLSQRLKRAHGNQSDKLYTYTPAQAWGQFLFGPLGKRGLNKQAANELASKEHLSDVPPEKRSYIRVFQRRQGFYTEMKRLGMLENGRLPTPLRDAFNIEAERQGSYTRESQGHKPGTADYHRARLEVDARLLAKYRQVPGPEAKQIVEWASTQTDIEKLKAARRWISDHYYQSPTGFLTLISESKKYLVEHGAKGLK